MKLSLPSPANAFISIPPPAEAARGIRGVALQVFNGNQQTLNALILSSSR